MTFSISISGMFYTMLPIFPAFFWLFLIYTFTASTTLNKLLPHRRIYTVQTYIWRRKNKTRPFQEKWYFVTKIVLTYCEKKMFYWSRKTFEIRDWRPRICKFYQTDFFLLQTRGVGLNLIVKTVICPFCIANY